MRTAVSVNLGGTSTSTRILWRNLEAAYEVFKAWVVVQRIESPVDFEQAENALAVLILRDFRAHF